MRTRVVVIGVVVGVLIAIAGGASAQGTPGQGAPAQAAGPEYFPSPGGGTLPFSEAVRVGSLLFVSGQVGAAPGSLTLVPGGFEPEARQTLANVKAILERHGSSMNDVVKCTVFLADMQDWPRFNVLYRESFTGRLPARSALGASGLALGARVELECIGYVAR